MTFNLLIPEISSRPENTKDAVISILTLEWPLTLREIYYKIKKHYGYSSTYQSVFKAVKELLKVNILKEHYKRYEINIDWIKRLQSFTDIVETNYFAKERLRNLSGINDSKRSEDLIILNFETIFDAEKYLYYFMKNELFKKKGSTVCFQFNYEWRPLYYFRAEYNYYKRLLEKGHKFYFSCFGTSNIEKESKEFYRSLGIKYKTIKKSYSNDTLVFEDYFIQIFIPEELKNKMKAHLEKNNKMGLLQEVLEKKSSIKVIINKDKELANELKNKITKEF
ncbi:MAG: hypothetical protein Q8N99_00885 [Nanoarchaeota archaeon]|nr:hypothetical protein [Nanoarchaeota archaeon]